MKKLFFILLFSLIGSLVYAQRTVTGTVTNEDNFPLSGVIITEKGTANKSTSGWEGKFSITTSSENAILSASLKGFRSQEILTEGKTVVNITLFSTTPEKAQQINEVVITALGIKESRALTYNVQKVSGAEIVDGGQGNILNSLSGKIAGVDIKSSASGVGAESRVVLRGTTSITQNNNALYVVDGILCLIFLSPHHRLQVLQWPRSCFRGSPCSTLKMLKIFLYSQELLLRHYMATVQPMVLS